MGKIHYNEGRVNGDFIDLQGCGESFRNPSFYREWSQKIDREWLHVLNGSEYALVRFIFDRTAGWNKEWERIPARQLVEGITSQDGRRFAPSIVKSLKHARRLLIELTERGILIRHDSTMLGANVFSINYKWNPIMKIPKRLRSLKEGQEDGISDGYDAETEQPMSIRTGTKTTLQGGQKLPQGGDKNYPTKISNIKISKKKILSAGADGLSLGEKENGSEVVNSSPMQFIEQAAKDAVTRQKHRAALKLKRGSFARRANSPDKTPSGLIPTADGMMTLWHKLHRETFHATPLPALTKAMLHALRGYAKEWNVRNPEHEFVTDFLPWVFENWGAIRNLQLGWMDNCPDTPSPLMVCSGKLREYIEAGWRERSKVDAFRQMSVDEREFYILTKVKGMAPDKAKQLVAESSKLRDSVDSDKRRIAKLEKLKRDIERAEKSAMFDNTITPRQVKPLNTRTGDFPSYDR